MKIFTAAQIRRWEAQTMQQQGISSIDLMQRAAIACYQWINEHIKLQAPEYFHVCCGQGNNGGDGLALAALLLEGGYQVTTYLLPDAGKQSAAFDYNVSRLQKLNCPIIEVKSSEDFPVLGKEDCVIDALLGIGLNRPLQDLPALLVEHINCAACIVVSIDVPSGMLTDESSINLLKVQATHTLSFQHYKLCFLLPENGKDIGVLQLLDIGLDSHFVATETAGFIMSDKQLIQSIYLPRDQFAHKGNFGHAYLLAGSFGKMGAAVLCAQACLRAGVGLLTVHVPTTGVEILQISTPEAMIVTGDDEPISRYAALGIGPGMGTEPQAVSLLRNVFQKLNSLSEERKKVSIVLDADALNILSAHPELLEQLPADSILTPHPKEFERLFGKSANDFERIKLAEQKANELQCCIILKGHHTFIASPGHPGYFNSTGNAGMATGGSGDVLTGILTGLLAQGYSSLHACLLGVYLHGSAGDLAAGKHSQEAMVASDITNCLGNAFLRLNE